APRDMIWFEGGEGSKVKEVDVTLPPDVRHQLVPDGRTLGDMVAAGDLDAYVGARPPAGGVRRAGDPALPRFPPARAGLLRDDRDLSDHALGRLAGRAGPRPSLAAAKPLRRVRRGQASGLRASELHRGAAGEPAVARGRGRGDAGAHGRRPVSLRRREEPQDARDAGRLHVRAGPGAPPAHDPGDVLGVDAGDLAGYREPKRVADRARAFAASASRSRAGALVTSESSSSRAACATWSTARAKATSLVLEGRLKPLSLRTNCRDDARISSSVAGGAKLCSVLMLRHMRH